MKYKGTELVAKQLNTRGNLYFIRSIEKPHKYWYIKSQDEHGDQVLGLQRTHQQAGVWTESNGNNFLDENNLRDDFKMVKVSDVTGHDESSN